MKDLKRGVGQCRGQTTVLGGDRAARPRLRKGLGRLGIGRSIGLWQTRDVGLRVADNESDLARESYDDVRGFKSAASYEPWIPGYTEEVIKSR